jgi:predicted  nucleic acid-binding Zn-ribbon protein
MTQIEELERRISAALDRIAYGVEALDAPAPVMPEPAPQPEILPPEADPEEVVSLREALADERLANAQLEERIRTIREKQDKSVKDLHGQVSAQRESLSLLDLDLQHLKRANDMLTSVNQELRAALAEKLDDPDLINKAMLAELESLRATRAVDAAETRAVLDALGPLLAEAANNPAEESA